VIKEINETITLNEKNLKQKSVKESVKSLGVYMNPSLTWVRQFEMIKEKMYRVMSKLRSTLLSVRNTYVFFNMYLITQVYFGYRIIELIPK